MAIFAEVTKNECINKRHLLWKVIIWPLLTVLSPWRKSRSCGAQFLRKFDLFAQNRNFFWQISPLRAIFAQIWDLMERKFSTKVRKFCNLTEDIYVFPRKFAF